MLLRVAFQACVGLLHEFQENVNGSVEHIGLGIVAER